MAGGIHTEIAAAQWASGRLWHPHLSFDMMGNDWAGFCLPLCYRHTATGAVVPTHNVWVDWFSMQLFLPPDWSGDATYDDIQIMISVEINCFQSGVGTTDIDCRIEDSADIVAIPGGAGYITLTRKYTSATWQSGQLELQFQHYSNQAAPKGVETNSINESHGPRAWVQVQQI